MSTHVLPPHQITGHQNQVNFQQINNYSAPTYTLNGRPATEEDTHAFLLGRAESAERELEAQKDTIEAQKGQIYLQQEIIKQLRSECARLQDNINKLREVNKAINLLIPQ